MPELKLTVSEDVLDVLLTIADQIAAPKELSVEERAEVAIDALVMSYDSATPDESGAPAEPADALDIARAVETALRGTDISVPLEHTKRQGDLEI